MSVNGALTPPTLTSLSVNTGPVGTTVILTGTTFSTVQGTSTVTFNGTTATATSWSNTSITVTVPVGATTGLVRVTVAGNTTTGITFTVTASGGCTFPSCFPDATNTGVPAGTVLTAYTGPFSFTSGTTTIDKKTITTCLDISGGTVNITKSNISVSAGCWDGEAVASHGAGIANITDSTISCGGDPPGGYNNSHGAGPDNLTMTRVNISGCENGLSIDGQNNLVVDSFIHDLRQCTAAECGPGDGSHTDGIQTGSGANHYTIRHNTIFSMKLGATTPETRDTYYTTSAIITDPADTNGIVEQNLIAGGAFAVYCPETGRPWVIQNNRWSTRYKSTVGFFGPSDACAAVNGGGNVYYETGLPITLSLFFPFIGPDIFRMPVLALR